MLFLTRLILCLGILFVPAGRESSDSPVLLTVEGKIWTVRDFENSVRNSSGSGPEDTLKRQALNELILRALMESWLKKNQISAGPSSPGFFPEHPLSSPEERRIFREKQGLFNLKTAVLNHLEKTGKPPSSREIRDFYQKNKKDFFTAPSCKLERIRVSSKGTARALIRRLQNGESFSRLARLHSTGPESAEGGSMGWIPMGVAEVFDTACKLKEGALGPPLKDSRGHHILRVVKKRPGGLQPLNRVRGKISMRLKRDRREAEFKKWLKAELKDALIFLDENLLDRIRVQDKTKTLL